ncbi:MAG: SRPBCC family protein [Holophagae bacterium]|jgi:ligand-binding SRPBCC domain-containing protein
MKTFQFRAEHWLPRPLDHVFPFFADAHNLEKLTPEWLRFDVLTPKPIPMEVGTTIDYRLRWHGIPLRWTSEIAAWEPPHRFVDRQIRGPYRLWHHEHRFSEADDGTRMVDEVTYAVWGGDLANRLGVARDVQRIFDYRTRVLDELFGEATADSA